ncbi:hypothetical protein [Deinococcus sp.]|uniref:hypothetical protein n=1 Tax=Deinococcus sp. TaxID=47478 RepID=UPI003C7B0C2A
MRPIFQSGLPMRRIEAWEVGCPRPARQSPAKRRPTSREVELGGIELLVLQFFKAIAGNVLRLTATGPLVAGTAEVGSQIAHVPVVLHLLQVERPVLTGGERGDRLGQHDQGMQVMNPCPATCHPDVTGGTTEQPFEFDPRQGGGAEIKVHIGRQGDDRVVKPTVWGDEQTTDDAFTVTEQASGPPATLSGGIGHGVR